MASALNVKKHRIIVLTHKDLIPPDNVADLSPEELSLFKTDSNVIDGLRKLGHEVLVVGLTDELAPLEYRSIDSNRI